MVSFAILGLDAKWVIIRTVYWLSAAGCLFIVGLAVSRGMLLAGAVAITVGFRGLLKRGFLPLLVLIILSGVIMESGLLGHIVSNYEERGMEETGRVLLWPYVVERILSSPIVGVGFTNISTYIPEIASSISTPHNSFLFYALSSGILPFASWLLFWIRSIRSGWRSFSHLESLEDGSFRVPFLLYLFIGCMLGDLNIDPWVLVAFSTAAGSPVFHTRKRLRLAGRIRGARTAQSVGSPSKAANL